MHCSFIEGTMDLFFIWIFCEACLKISHNTMVEAKKKHVHMSQTCKIYSGHVVLLIMVVNGDSMHLVVALIISGQKG